MKMYFNKREIRALSIVLRYYTKNSLGGSFADDDPDSNLPYEIYDEIYPAQFWNNEDLEEDNDK